MHPPATCFLGIVITFILRQVTSSPGQALTSATLKFSEDLIISRYRYLTTIRTLHKEYSVKFEVKPTQFEGGWTNILHLTSTNTDCCEYGSRAPGIWFNPASSTSSTNKLTVSSSVNQTGNHHYTSASVPLGSWTSVEITQTLKSDSKVFRYQVRVNGKLIGSVVNKAARELQNVHLYVSDPWHKNVEGLVRGLTVTGVTLEGESTTPPITAKVEPIPLRDAVQSGNFDAYYCTGNKCPAWKAVDGNVGSESRSDWRIDPSWWSAQLTKTTRIAYLRLYLTEWYFQKGYYNQFKIETKVHKEEEWKICRSTHSIQMPVFPHQVTCKENSLARFIKLTLYGGSSLSLKEVMVFGTPLEPYFRTRSGKRCPTVQRIRNESSCKDAASELGLIWGSTWWSPSDSPGCVYVNDGRNKVFFNTALNASGSNETNAEICRKSVIESEVEELEWYVNKVDVKKTSERSQFLNLTNEILKNEKRTIKEAAVASRTIHTLTKFIEKIGAHLLNTSDESTTTISNSEVSVAVARHDKGSGATLTATDASDNITVDIRSANAINDIPASPNFLARAFLDADNFPPHLSNKSLIFAIGYRYPKLFPSNISDDVSMVFSIAINSHSKAPQPLSSPIRIDFNKSFQSHAGKLSCVYWKFPDVVGDGVGRWDTSGCWKVREIDTVVTCECDHLTNLAVLVLDPDQAITLSPLLLKILEVISIAGSSISFIALIVTIALHTVIGGRRVWNRLRSKLLVQLCVSLMILMILFFLFAKNRNKRVDIPCKITSGLIHYFLLVAFMAMGCEAWEVRRSVLRDEVSDEDEDPHRAQEHHDSRFAYACFGASMILPVIVVVALVYEFPQYYGNKNYCLVRNIPFYISVLLPLVVLVSLSVSVIFRARNTMLRVRERKCFPQIKFVVGKIFLFGVTWFIGAFGYGPLAPIFQPIFVVLNSVQGFFIFLFVVSDKEYRDDLISGSRLCCKKQDSSGDVDQHTAENASQEEIAMIRKRPTEERDNSQERFDEVPTEKDDIDELKNGLLNEVRKVTNIRRNQIAD